MADLVQLMSIVRGIDPAIWDAIIPHGPAQRLGSHVGRGHGTEAELNPQPIPPGTQLALASARVARRIADAAAAAEAIGDGGATRLMQRVADEWCGTVPRPPIPWPHPWPGPSISDPEMLTAMDAAAARVVGALTLAAAAASMSDGEARDALAKGAERLLATAIGG